MSETDNEEYSLSEAALQRAVLAKEKERDRLQKKLDTIRARKTSQPATTVRVVTFVILGPRLSRRLKTWTSEWSSGESPVPVEQTADVFEAFIHRLVGRRRTIAILALVAAIPAFLSFWMLWKQNTLMAEQINISESEAYEADRVDLLTKIYDLAPSDGNFDQVRAAALRAYLELERTHKNAKPEGPRINLVSAPLGEVLLQDLDLSGLDLRYADIPSSTGRCDFVETDCRAARFDNSSIINGKIHRSGFIGSIWTGISGIAHCSISESLFQNAKMQKVSLRDSLVHDSDFSEADLTNATISGVRFSDSSFVGANLSGVQFNASMLNAIQSPLPESPTVCEFSNVDFTKADLRGSVFAEATVFENVVFEETLIDEKTVLPRGISRESAGLISAEKEVEQ